MKILKLVLLALLVPVVLHAEPVGKLYAAANGVWQDGNLELPSDFEVGATGRASLQPHISLVGAAYWGFNRSYIRGTAGVRATATDATNPNFSVGVGLEYQGSSEPKIRPEEWMTTVSVGYRPWPQTAPRVILGAQGAYGLDTKQAQVLVGVRYFLSDFAGGAQ